MRIHLQLLDGSDAVLTEGTFESPVITISAHQTADLRHEDLLETLTVETDGFDSTFQALGRTHPLRQRNTFRLSDSLTLRIDLYPRAEAVRTARGGCPSCGARMQASLPGGAYRSIVHKQRRCTACDTAVLELDDAPNVLGHFTDLNATDWVLITVAQRCPDCTGTMLRSVLRSARGEAEVERCPRCRLVVIEADDERRLVG